MRKIIAYVATSADGFIARPDGDVGWLDRPEPPGGYGMKAFYRTVDTVLLGRKTWDVGRKHGQLIFIARFEDLSAAVLVAQFREGVPESL